jgi:hypothetical protein
VIEPKEADKAVTLNVELVPAPKKTVRVVGPDGKPVAGCDATGTTPLDMYPLHQEAALVAVYSLGPKERRFVVVVHQRTKLIGQAVVGEADRDPVVTLGPGGAVTGRIVGADGKPIAGVSVLVRFDHPGVQGVSELLRGWKAVVTGADGKFRVGTLFPGHGFRLQMSKGAKFYGPPLNLAPQHKVEKHGEQLDLGDVKAGPRDSTTES